MTKVKANSRIRHLWIGFTILGSVGLLTVIVLTGIEGVKYRLREEQGLDPIWAPTWVATTTYVAMAVIAFALVALAVTGIVALVGRRRRNSRRTAALSESSTT